MKPTTRSNQVQNWRHKFRTPKREKNKNSKSLGWIDKLSATPTPLRQEVTRDEEIEPSARTPTRANTKSHDDTMKVQKSTETNSCSDNYNYNYNLHKIIPLTYPTMRSIVCVITGIEKVGGRDDMILKSYTGPIETMYTNVIQKCSDMMINNDKEIKINGLKDFSIEQLVVALKLTLFRCEQLVPLELERAVLEIKEGDEIETILCDTRWSDVQKMTFIYVLHHVAKVFKLHRHKSDEGGSTYSSVSGQLMNNLAEVFSSLLLCRDINDRPIMISRLNAHSKVRVRRRALKKIIRHFASTLSVMGEQNLHTLFPTIHTETTLDCEGHNDDTSTLRRVLFQDPIVTKSDHDKEMDSCDEDVSYNHLDAPFLNKLWKDLKQCDCNPKVMMKEIAGLINRDDDIDIKTRERLQAANIAMRECESF